MRKLLGSLAIFLVSSSAIFAQSIQWSHLLLQAEINLVAKDSTESTLSVFKSRLFLYDSLHAVSKETGVAFFEHAYFADFKKAQQVAQIIFDLKAGSRLLYYIKLYDEENQPHLVYNYGAIRPCAPEIKTLVLTIAHTPYKVKRIEVGTFQKEDDHLVIGVSEALDVNNVIQELVAQRFNSLCNKASYFTDKILLSENVNSSDFEVKPVISPDGKTLYFHRQNHKENKGGKRDDQDIYITRLVNDTWSPAANIDGPLNDNMPNGVASVSSGETSLFLINEYIASNQQRQGLSVSEKTLSGWSFPKKIDVRNFYNRSPYIDYFISPTQNEMILAVQRDDAYGDQDLYVSFYDDATASWTEPLNLGADINSMVSETSPFLAADGKTLYFASDGFLGYGGFDIFVSRRLDDSWTKWSFPENLGPIVNTSDDDLYYTVSAAGDHAYFVTTTQGDRNIYTIPLPTIYKPEPVVLLAGKIFSQTTLKPEEAEIQLRWHGEHEIIGTGKSDPVTGEYKIVLPSGGLYDYTVVKDGHSPVSGVISTIKTKNYEEKQQNILISSMSNDDNVVSVIDFAELQSSDRTKELSAFLKHFETLKVNLEVSQDSSLLKVAEVLSVSLIKSGIASTRIQTGSSETKGRVIIVEDSTRQVNETILPDGYSKPVFVENTDVSLLLKGKVLDAATFRPLRTRMIFRSNNRVKSRSASDPITGNFQTLLPANTPYDIVLFQDSLEHHINFRTPNVANYSEVRKVCLINQGNVDGTTLEVGSGFSVNRDVIDQTRWERQLTKRKRSKEFLRLSDTRILPASRFETDLNFIAEVMNDIPSMTLRLKLHAAAGVTTRTLEQIGQRCLEILTKQNISPDRLKVSIEGNASPRHRKKKHHSNNRIVADVTF